MKKQVFGMIAALIALTVMLLTGAYAAEAPANAESAAPDADAETETAELSAENTAYAILYEDGTLVFQTSETPESGRAVKKTYKVDLNAVYDGNTSHSPWYNERESVLMVNFLDKISPTSTAYWFWGCGNLKRVDNIQNLDTASVTNMSYMFDGCWRLTTLDLSHFDTSNVTTMITMFGNCRSLTALDLSHFDTSNVTRMEAMFSNCTGLAELDLSHFNTSKVMFMDGMFDHCSGLKALDLSHFDTSNVADMRYMFDYCSGLEALDLSHFDTSNVTETHYMFYACSGLVALDLSHFDTSNVADMRYMFGDCSKLQTIYTSDKFTTTSVERDKSMFYDCTSLVGGNGTAYDESHTDKEYARIDTANAKGYFTYKAAPAPVKYAIADAVIKDGTLSVTLTNPDAVTLAVSYFDSDGKFLSAESQSVGANVGAASLALSADAKKFCVMLCDTDWRPLCRFAADI